MEYKSYTEHAKSKTVTATDVVYALTNDKDEPFTDSVVNELYRLSLYIFFNKPALFRATKSNCLSPYTLFKFVVCNVIDL